MLRRRTKIVVAALGLVLGLLVVLRLAAISRPVPTQPKEEAALSVETIAARIQPMPVFLRAAGEVVSEHMVQIRPQISGMLKQVFFTEG